MDVRKILCPIDFSTTADRALRVAVTMARRFGASLELLHVYQTPDTTAALAVTGELGSAREDLESLHRGADPAGEVPTTVKVIDGTPHVEILREARSGRFDMIVMGTLGRTGLSRLVIGSVAERVVREAPCPVITVREPD